MLLNSTAKILSSSQMPVVEESSFDASLKDNFDHYKACAIKLHLLADSCPEDPSEQAELERIQAECIKGQMDVIKFCSEEDISSDEDAKYMMALWQEEVLNSQTDAHTSDTDRMIIQLFSYFQKSLGLA